MALNDRLEQIGLTNIYTTFHLQKAKYPFFSNTHEIFSKIDQIIGPKLTSTETRGTTIKKAQSNYKIANNQDQTKIK